MGFLLLVLVGFAPGIFWLWLIYQRDKYIPAPVHLVVRTFLWGILVAAPVVIVERVLLGLSEYDLQDVASGSDLLGAAFLAFIVAGMTEEIAKYLAVKKTVYGSPYFRQPLDGLIFAAAVALGFASIENVGYMFAYGAGVILVRAPISTVAHVVFSAAWGYGLGMQAQNPASKHLPVALLVVGIGFHGLFDFFLFAGSGLEGWPALVFLTGILLFLFLVKVAQRQSPFRDKIAAAVITCGNCDTQSGYGSRYCIKCGQALAKLSTSACSQCGTVAQEFHAFCTGCGSRLDRKRVTTTR